MEERKTPRLPIFDLFCAATILTRHSGFLVSPLGEAGFVDGHNRIRISQVGQDIAAQFVTDAVLIPDGIAEEALHSIGTAFSGLGGSLPAIFARHITQDADAGYKRQRWRGSGRAKEGAMRAWRDRHSAPQQITSLMVVFDPTGVLWCFCFTVFSLLLSRSRVRFTPSECHSSEKNVGKLISLSMLLLLSFKSAVVVSFALPAASQVLPTFWPPPAQIRSCHLLLESPVPARAGRPRRGGFTCHRMQADVVSHAMGNCSASVRSGGGESAQTHKRSCLPSFPVPCPGASRWCTALLC